MEAIITTTTTTMNYKSAKNSKKIQWRKSILQEEAMWKKRAREWFKRVFTNIIRIDF